MTVELVSLLIIAFALPITTILAAGFYSKQIGTVGLVGNRENLPLPEGLAGRARRAHANLLENAVPFAIVVLMAHVLGVSNGWTVAAAIIFVAARFAYHLTYLAGITVVRTLAFYAGLASTVVIATQLFS